MIDAYAIGVAAKLEDGVSPGLMKIISYADKAQASLDGLLGTIKALSKAGINLGRNLGGAAKSAAALGDSAGALTRASYVLDTMATSSAAIARNLRMAGAEGGRVGPGGTGSGSSSPSGSGGRYGSNLAKGTLATGIFGIYENARLQDTNIRSAATSQTPISQWNVKADELRSREMSYAKKYAWASGGKIAPFGESILESSRLLRTLPGAQQKQMLDMAMPYIAAEAKLKDVGLGEATEAFIGLAHQAGAYTPQTAAPLFNSMLEASLTTDATLAQITRASSYALPSLRSAGADPSTVLMLVASMMQAGIMNTKSGTWLNNLGTNSIPKTLGSGLFKSGPQSDALKALGLYKNGKSSVYTNGKLDMMKLVGILNADRNSMAPDAFLGNINRAFGKEGGRAAALFSEDTTMGNVNALMKLRNSAGDIGVTGAAIKQFSTVSQADQTIANANITLMNATDTFMGPVNKILSGMSDFFSWTAAFTKKHPVIGGVMDVGIVGGVVAGLGGAWAGGKIVAKKLAMIIAEKIGGKYLLIAAVGGAMAYWIGGAIQGILDFIVKKVTFGHFSSMRDLVGDTNPFAPHKAAQRSGASGTWSANAPVIHNHFHVDGKEVHHSVMQHSTPQPSRGTTGMNPMHSPLMPSGAYK